MIVYKISEETAIKLKNKTFAKNERFNPIKDKNGNWVITKEELDGINKPDYDFLNEKNEQGSFVNIEPINFDPIDLPNLIP